MTPITALVLLVIFTIATFTIISLVCIAIKQLVSGQKITRCTTMCCMVLTLMTIQTILSLRIILSPITVNMVLFSRVGAIIILFATILFQKQFIMVSCSIAVATLIRLSAIRF